MPGGVSLFHLITNVSKNHSRHEKRKKGKHYKNMKASPDREKGFKI